MFLTSLAEFDDPGPDETAPDYPRIYLFGDSLTERGFFEQNNGFGWKLGKYYEDRVEVVNRGYGGQTTRSLRDHFDKWVLGQAERRGPPAPLFITIFLGANDACFAGHDTYVPIAEYEEHIRYYATSILENPATKGTKVILITPPPIDVPPQSDLSEIPPVREAEFSIAKLGMGPRTWASKRRFAEKIVEIGREFEEKSELVAVLDFWTAITKFSCREKGKTDEEYAKLDDDEMLPGSGMPGTWKFGRSVFTDGLHLGKKVLPLSTASEFSYPD
ncbi:hypothetical protein AJ80_01368 [Polytolypa hystricis UAMH7299]|uniref:Uncharacterized protein n=1 Tax=Polytolypa hystricis (strain UAMH7299) TaxID=1447883 RepID=A0A2B7YSH4_POLH7|nr:hypothetical protein AJ80_01368 [Polytolypa hystricis UAMH7299]